MKEIKKDNLLNGVTVSTLVKGITLAAGTYERGAALCKVAGKHILAGETGADATNFDCILAEGVILEADGVATAYFTGEFSENAVIVKEGFDLTTLVESGRKLNIFIS